jgi:hypothetical protein
MRNLAVQHVQLLGQPRQVTLAVGPEGIGPVGQLREFGKIIGDRDIGGAHRKDRFAAAPGLVDFAPDRAGASAGVADQHHHRSRARQRLIQLF